jgi:hypothetical protein
MPPLWNCRLNKPVSLRGGLEAEEHVELGVNLALELIVFKAIKSTADLFPELVLVWTNYKQIRLCANTECGPVLKSLPCAHLGYFSWASGRERERLRIRALRENCLAKCKQVITCRHTILITIVPVFTQIHYKILLYRNLFNVVYIPCYNRMLLI